MRLTVLGLLLGIVGVQSAAIRALSPFYDVYLQDQVPEEYIVQLKPGHTIDDHCTAVGLNISQIAPIFQQLHLINAYHAKLSSEIIHQNIRSDPGVAYVQQVKRSTGEDSPQDDGLEQRDLQAEEKRGFFHQGAKGEFAYYPSADWSHQMTTSNSFYDDGAGTLTEELYEGGAGVNVYVFDVGIEGNHNAFRQTGVRNFRSEVPGATYTDPNGHGTHVAGIIASPNLGVSPNVNIVNVVTNAPIDGNPSGVNIYNFANALQAVIMEHIAFREDESAPGRPANWRGSVINLSFSTATLTPAEEAMLAMARREGIPIIVAAGNQGSFNVGELASNEDTFTVGAVDRNYAFYHNSNYGPSVNLFAPGVRILSASNIASNAYLPQTGTSQATAFVSSMAAMIVAYEGLNGGSNDVDTVYERLIELSVQGAITGIPDVADRPTPNRLLNSGVSYGGHAGTAYPGATGNAGEGSSGTNNNNNNKVAENDKVVELAASNSTSSVGASSVAYAVTSFTTSITTTIDIAAITAMPSANISAVDDMAVVSNYETFTSCSNATICPLPTGTSAGGSWTTAQAQHSFSGTYHPSSAVSSSNITTKPSSTSSTPSTTSAAPLETCHTQYKLVLDTFDIYGLDWDESKLDGSGAYRTGNGLFEQLKGCSAITDWQFVNMTVSDTQPYQWHASGQTTIWQKTCIEHAMNSAGSPSEACSGSG